MSDDSFGACVVLIPSFNGLPDEVDGGQHITLAYFGDTVLEEIHEVELLRIASTLMNNNYGHMSIEPTGIDRFGDDGDAVVVTCDDRPDSIAVILRDELIERMSSELRLVFQKAETFPTYKPHMTMGYISEGFVDSDIDLPDRLNIRGIGVWNGTSRTTINNRNDDTVAHYGIIRKSGRYPWGSGGSPYQRSQAFYNAYDQLKAEGLNEKEIAKLFGEQSTPANPEFNTSALRSTRSLAKDEKRAGDRAMILKLQAKGMKLGPIAERMKMPESTVRSLLKDSVETRVNITRVVSDKLRESITKDQYLDIGKGTENWMGVSPDRLKTAVAILRDEGYERFYVPEEQLGMRGQKTNIKILTPPGTTFPEVMANKERIKNFGWHSDDGGRTMTKPGPPKSVAAKRVSIRYAEDGGTDRDGLIEIRPGVKDLDLGHNRYAQVRIAVGDTHYLKGMAIYSDDIPAGSDIRFNTNKSKDVPALGPKNNSVLKDLKRDKDGNIDNDAPFGAMIKTGGQRGALNIVNEEGDWDQWSKKFSSQMLSKQNNSLAKQQLKLTKDNKEAELAEIIALTNPTVKKRLLEAYADNSDSQAVTLKAMGLPRTATKVLMPFPEMRETEIYAPTYKNGERVVLVRHPHGGVFEIPELVVNNRNPVAKAKLADAKDAVGIHPKVATQLSGADFDGDTVLVIPQNGGPQGVKVSRTLSGLKNFDAQDTYKGYPGMKVMSNTQNEMGSISNLITDMTIGGANESEIAAAVRHSMVVIDAEKHGLNYKQSEIDNGIKRLKELYQPRGADGKAGASTIISRASSRIDVPKFKARAAKDGGAIDKKTGALVYVETGAGYDKTTTNKRTGETTTKFVVSTQRTERMRATSDAHTLVSTNKTPIEILYADYANEMKGLANRARLEMINTVEPKKSPTAAVAYKPEVAELTRKLNIALMNAPIERQAQIVGNAILKVKMDANPDMDADDIKKARTRALDEARLRTGAKKEQVTITPREWEAIQARAVSPSRLREILRHADLDTVKEYATPRTVIGVSPALLSRARAMLANGYPQSEVAEALGMSVSTLAKALV